MSMAVFEYAHSDPSHNTRSTEHRLRPEGVRFLVGMRSRSRGECWLVGREESRQTE